MKQKQPRKPSFGESAVLLFVIFAFILTGITFFKVDPHILLVLATGVVVAFSFFLGHRWDEMEKSMFGSVASAIQPMVIIMCIGMVVGGWIACGTVPYMVYWGIKILSPKWFLVSCVLMCSIMSMSIGSSWTTLGTIGVALMGVGTGLGVPAPMTAGAVLCGSFFGDKQSPLSDTTNFAPAVAGTTLYEHVRSMLYTTTPGLLITLGIFTFLGFKYSNGVMDVERINLILTTLKDTFNFNVALLIPLFVLVAMILKKVPAVMAMGIASLLGLIFAMAFQGADFGQALTYLHYGYKGTTGVPVVDKLLTRGGLHSMLWTISLMIVALSMVGALEKTGVMKVVLAKLSKVVSSRFGLVTATLWSAIGFSCVAPEANLAMVLPGKMYGPAFDRLGIDRKVLSRTLEDGTTLVAPMIPWHTGAVYAATTLGVATLAYWPYYILGIATPIVSMILAATGFGIFKARPETLKEAGYKVQA